MGGAVSAGENNDDLIDNLLEADYIKSSGVECVFRAVDRAHYLTDEFKDNAYKDLAWKNGNLHISAPCIYSEVMESLKLSPGLSFLNLGSGTGYLSTMAGLILGPYGVNHGVEIHEDVIQYALERLNEFCQLSSALDKYEFCKPKFVLGDCLNINIDERLYDRVYCGAACPETHENYMKNLIKIGGVLVMPLNDQLFQIIRTSETTWDVKSVLPVSFASLLVPTQTPVPDPVKLPDSEPLCLQDICRSTIRCLLRTNVELEHPDLTTSRLAPKKVWKKRTLRRFVVPIFEESDTEEYLGTIPTDDMAHLGRANLFFDFGRESNGQIGTVIDWARSLAIQHHLETLPLHGPAVEIDIDEIGERSEERPGDSSPTQRGNEAHKRVKFDSGIGDDMENGKGLSSESEDSVSLDTDSDSEETLWHTGCNHNTRATFKPNTSCDETATQGSGAEGGEENPVPDGETVNPVNPNLYGWYMGLKINALPLPMQLKRFLNMYRHF